MLDPCRCRPPNCQPRRLRNHRTRCYVDFYIMRKLSTETREVLIVLLDAPREEAYGFELTRAAGLASGTVYPILRRLEGMGWVTSHWETINESRAGRRRRRYYHLTDEGLVKAQMAVAAQAPALRQLVPGWRVA